MIKVMEIKTDKSRDKKRSFPVDAAAAFTFGVAETMKQGFTNGNCWLMALGVLAIVYALWRSRG